MFNNIISDFDVEEYAELHTIISEVKQLGEYRDDLKAYFRGEYYERGARLPWMKTFNHIEFAPSELTLWGGSTGHGKSLMMGQVIVSLMQQKKKCLIASFEMPPLETLARMNKQAVGNKNPNDSMVDAFTDIGNEYLYIYHLTGMVQSQRILAMCRYAVEVLKVEFLVIDNLMTCIEDDDDYNAQKNFVAALKSIALSTGLHIHLVCHLKKLTNEKELPCLNDIKGSSAITSFADNAFLVWRNMEKSKMIAENPGYFDREVANAVLILGKNRKKGVVANYGLWFDEDSLQFKNDADTPIQNYLG